MLDSLGSLYLGFLGIIALYVAIQAVSYSLKRPVPKTPEELEQERLKRQQDDAARLRHNLEIAYQQEAARKEWRSKYSSYLKSSKWKRVRKRVLEKAEYTCAKCGGKATQVHHIRYSKSHATGEPKRENYGHLEALCGKCHKDQHGL